MDINILGTKVHVGLVFFGTLCVVMLFACIGVISWGGWKMNQQDEANKQHSVEMDDLENKTKHLETEDKKLQEETKKLSRQIENLDRKSQNETEKLKKVENLSEKSQKETEKLNQTIQLIQKFTPFLFDQNCDGQECLLCQKGWTLFSESCYFLSTFRLTWERSREFCQFKSADLVIIDNQQEQEFIYNNINSWTWFGLWRIGSNWVWIDGRIDTLRFWYSPYPYYDHSYAVMYPSGRPTESWFTVPYENQNIHMNQPFCEQKAFKVSLN